MRLRNEVVNKCETSDMYLTAYLLYAGCNLISKYTITNFNGKRTVFVFENHSNIDDLQLAYINGSGEAKVDAKRYADMIKFIKNLVHSPQPISAPISGNDLVNGG